MKINTLVLLDNAGLARFGVVKSLSTTEDYSGTTTSAKVRLINGRAPFTVETSPVLLIDLTADMDRHEWSTDPVLCLLRLSSDYEQAVKYRQARLEKPTDDPDDPPF